MQKKLNKFIEKEIEKLEHLKFIEAIIENELNIHKNCLVRSNMLGNQRFPASRKSKRFSRIANALPITKIYCVCYTFEQIKKISLNDDFAN